MNYFHKSVDDYMKAFSTNSSQKRLEKLAKQVIIDVENSIDPPTSDQKKLHELHIKKRRGPVKSCDVATSYEKDLNKIATLKIKWTTKDLDILQENWNTFCKKYDVDNPFWFLKLNTHKDYLRRKYLLRFKLYLSNGLNHDYLVVYNKWQRLICFPKTGKFSDAELSLTHKLMCHYKAQKLKYVVMVALQRNRMFVANKLRDLKNAAKTGPVQMNWTVTLEEELIRCLIDELEAKNLKDMDQIIRSWQWAAVSKKLGLTRNQVYNHWYGTLQPALMVQKWVTRGELHIQLIKRLKWLIEEDKVNDWKQINWAELGQYVGGFGSLFVSKQVLALRWNYVHSSEDRKNIHASINVLWNEAVPHIRKREELNQGHYLRRLIYNWTSQSLQELQPPALDFTGIEIDNSSED